MRGLSVSTTCVVALLLSFAVDAEAQLTVREAAAIPVAGWEMMVTPDGSQTLWVSPDAGLTALDIEDAQADSGPGGELAVALRFTEAGAEKMRALSAAHMNQPLAIVLDGDLVSAPVVRAEMGAVASITGGPDGLSVEQVQRILAGIDPQ